MKKLIIIGDFGYFPDSLIYFTEKNFQIYMVKMENRLAHFKISDTFAEDLNIKIIDKSEAYFKLLDKETLIISGPCYFGDCYSNSFEPSWRISCIETMEYLYSISKYNKQHNCGAKIVRYFNGDTGFGTQEALDYFNEKIKYIDYLCFDNEALRDFVLKNSAVAQRKTSLIGWLETPLKRYCVHNTSKPLHSFISLGRCLSTFDELKKNDCKLPIMFFPRKRSDISRIERWKMKLTKRKKCYKLAGGVECLESLYHDRKLFKKLECQAAFGLSHMYDIFWGSVEKFKKNKEFYLSVKGQQEANCAASPKEQYYAFVNNPNKDACYLMCGIIPLISHQEHDFYRELIKRKMAILIKQRKDLAAVLKMPDTEIQSYRDNIYKNRDLFTFDHVGEMLCNLLDK